MNYLLQLLSVMNFINEILATLAGTLSNGIGCIRQRCRVVMREYTR